MVQGPTGLNVMLDIFIASVAMTAACFALLLIPRGQSKSPLVMVLLCLVFFSSGTLVFALMPALTQLYVSLIPAVFFLFLPALWLYHDATISSTLWRWRKSQLKQFIAIPFMLMLGIALFALPRQDFEQMFFSSNPVTTPWLEFLSIAFFVSVIGWCTLSFGYVVNIIGRTLKYRKQIKTVYADEAGRDLTWLSITSALIVLTWVYGLVVLAVDNRLQDYGISETGVLVLLAVIVWIVAFNGLRQRPGFEDTQLAAAAVDDEPENKPYERSALSKDDLQRISEKLVSAVSNDQVHLEPDLNLLKLAKHVGEPSQYVSQTLSQQLNTNFFDFINQARIEAAKELLTSTDDSVLDIAYSTGFNSRSSFYKAFRQYMHQTPSQYRKS